MNAKILIVDDEPGQQQLLRYNIEKSGFDVLIADNGNDALNIVDEVKPDLIALDWMIPEASGIDICYELRSRPETRNLPILMVSAR
ncbi:MAG: response regulator, partial [Pseudomonadota bacterium]|nr:response regulator [Pseudomonadota bacterium]